MATKKNDDIQQVRQDFKDSVAAMDWWEVEDLADSFDLKLHDQLPDETKKQLLIKHVLEKYDSGQIEFCLLG